MTPNETASRFEARARADFEQRVAEAREGYLRLAESANSAPLVAAVCEMEGAERYAMLRRVMRDTSGPTTLEGMEGLVAFVSGVMRGEPGYAVASEPDEPEIDPAFHLLLATARAKASPGEGEEEVRRAAETSYASRERRMVVLVGRERQDGLAATAGVVLEAIAFNRDLSGRLASNPDAVVAARMTLFRQGRTLAAVA